MIKRFIIAFILLVLVCGGIVGFNIFRDQAIQQFFANMPRPALAVSTAKVEPVTWTPGIEAIGTVNARSGVDLTVETTGIVRDLLFAANAKVKAGQPLLQLDDAVERADLDAQRAQASLDKSALDRALELQRRGVGTDQSVDAANAAAITSQANVAKLQAVLEQKQLQAPFAGTMGIPRVDQGQYVSPGTVVATLQDLDTMRADFTVPEQELDKLKIGQGVRLGTDQATWPFSGKITGIDPKVDPSSRLVSVRAEVSNPEGRLTPGQFVQVRVDLPEEKNVIAVAQTAIVSSLYGDYVYVVSEAEAAKPATADAKAASEPPAAAASDKTTPEAPKTDAVAPAKEGASAQAAPAADAPNLTAKQIFVKTGRRSAGLVEIVSGIEAGQTIVTAGQNRLSNGAPVTVDNTIDPTKALDAGSAP
jgi:membrane fusion protein (multidrug efflux system)